jgi:GNAT superfamily N-acetyltransferase
MHALESAAFAAWPALEQEDLYGWHLRFARGYTKRANSANCTPEAAELSEDRLAHIERLYRARGQTPVFRLTSCAAPPQTDSFLASKGYRFTDPSLVMTAPLTAVDAPAPAAFTADAETWLDAFQQVSGKLGPDQAIHLDMLKAIQAPCAFASKSSPPGHPVCCGLGVLVKEQLGLFDIATRPANRQQGLARALCTELLAWGAQSAAKLAFLQVVASNAAAIHLYEKMGFRRAYTYWYRVGTRCNS